MIIDYVISRLKISVYVGLRMFEIVYVCLFYIVLVLKKKGSMIIFILY